MNKFNSIFGQILQIFFNEVLNISFPDGAFSLNPGSSFVLLKGFAGLLYNNDSEHRDTEVVLKGYSVIET